MDEITLAADTRVSQLKDGEVTEGLIDPTGFGFSYCCEEDLAGGDAVQNAKILREILDGSGGPPRDITLMNAGVAILQVGQLNP